MGFFLSYDLQSEDIGCWNAVAGISCDSRGSTDIEILICVWVLTSLQLLSFGSRSGLRTCLLLLFHLPFDVARSGLRALITKHLASSKDLYTTSTAARLPVYYSTGSGIRLRVTSSV